MTIRNGAIYAYIGLMGSGKTMGMVRTALRQHRPIWANFDMSGCASYHASGIHRLRTFEQLADLREVCILLDELQLNINARSFANKFNMDFSEFLELRVRKRGSCFLYTTQDFDMVDVNVRRLTGRVYHHLHINARGESGAKVTMLIREMGDNYRVGRRFVMKHSPYFGLFNSFDEDVKLAFGERSSGDGRPKPRQAKPERGGPAPVESRRSLL